MVGLKVGAALRSCDVEELDVSSPVPNSPPSDSSSTKRFSNCSFLVALIALLPLSPSPRAHQVKDTLV